MLRKSRHGLPTGFHGRGCGFRYWLAAALENAAAAILVGDTAATYAEALALAAESVDSGRALQKLDQLLAAAR